MNANTGNAIYPDPAWSLTRRYIIALSAIALLSAFSQAIVQRALKKQEKDSYIINTAGRQRMLSQKICKLALELNTPAMAHNNSVREDLQQTVLLWEKFHQGLYDRDPALSLEGENSKEIQDLFKDIEPGFVQIRNNSASIADVLKRNPDATVDRYVARILSVEKEYLKGMDKIVYQYQEEARRKVFFLEMAEICLMLITLLVLLLEAYFIFRPAVNKIRQTIDDLVEAEKRTGIAYSRLCEAEHELKKVNEALEGKVNERTHEILEKQTELEQMNERLSMINKDLDTFVYSASHDLKAPINNIQRLIELLEEEVPEARDKGGPLIEMMKESLRKFQHVISDLGETGKSRIMGLESEKEIYFHEQLEDIRVSLQGVISSSEAIIKEDFSRVEKIRFSSKNLRSILYNLISNAIKYHSPDRTPEVIIKTEKMGEFVVVKVTDNGLGIEKKDFGKVFGIYNRLHSHVEGTGVGMNIVARIVENNGGKIEIESEVGKGSTFAVYLKVKEQGSVNRDQ